MKKLLILTLLELVYLLSLSEVFAQKLGEKIAYVKDNSYKINSLDSNSELSFLKSLISDKRIVMLGERFHTDGTTLDVKKKIVKYLHEEMDFDVLLIELPYISIDWSNNNSRSRKEYIENIGPNFNNKISNHYFDLISYCYNSKATNDPLFLEGIDLGIGYMKEELVSYIDSSFKVIDSTILKSDDYLNYKSLILSNYYNANIDLLNKLKIYTDTFIKIIEEKGQKSDRLIQSLKSIYQLADWEINRPHEFNCKDDKDPDGYDNIRDKYMSENVEWFIDKVYPNRKVIIWTSTYHTSRNVEDINIQSNNRIADVPMGDYLWRKYTNQIYSLAFIAYQGQTGHKTEKSIPILKSTVKLSNGIKVTHKNKKDPFVEDIKKPPKESIEDIMHKAMFEFAVLDFKNIKNEGMWLKDYNWMYPSFHKPFKTDWTKIYDGVFFINTMYPDNRRVIKNIKDW